MKTKIEVIPLEIPKLQLLLDMIQAKLGEDVAQPFRQLLDSYIQLLDLIHNQQISIRKLQQLLFGAKTERTSNVVGAGNGSSPGDGSMAQGQEGGGGGSSLSP